MWFLNVLSKHANEIHMCYDCANYSRTVPGLQSIISALVCKNVCLKKFGRQSIGH